MFKTLHLFPVVGCLLIGQPSVQAAETYDEQIDKLISAKANGKPVSARSDDAEFLRRVYLDFTGKIPSVERAKRFFADKSPQKAHATDRRVAGGFRIPGSNGRLVSRHADGTSRRSSRMDQISAHLIPEE